jgi:hypothetical protein
MRRLLPGREASWYLKDNLPALLGTVPALVIGKLLMRTELTSGLLILALAFTGLFALLGACLATPLVRGAIIHTMSRALRAEVA